MAKDRQPRRIRPYTHLLLAAVVLMIGVSGFAIYRMVRLIKKPPKHTEIVICEDCGHIFRVEFSAGASSPFVCEKCGQRRAYMAFVCGTCGKIFPHTTPESDARIECSHCYGTDVEQLLYLPPEELKTGPDE